jgi:hypothetical protein
LLDPKWSTYTPFAQFAESMAATLAGQSKHARPLSAFAAFQGHFLTAFAAFRPGICAITFFFDRQLTV